MFSWTELLNTPFKTGVTNNNNPALNHKTGNRHPKKLTAYSVIQKAANIHSLQQAFNAEVVFLLRKGATSCIPWKSTWIKRSRLKLFRLYLLLPCTHYRISLSFLSTCKIYTILFLGRREKKVILKISKDPTPWSEGNGNWRRIDNTLHCQATGK